MKKNEFADYIVHDALSGLDGVTARAMFGGFGIYRNGVFFGIIVDDKLYFKVDETNIAEYKAMGSSPFIYTAKDSKKMTMSYWKVLPDTLEDRETRERLALISYAIGARAALEKKKKSKRQT